MGQGLVHILNEEIFSSRIKAVGFDLDGTLTDLHRGDIQDMMGNKILDALPGDLKRALSRPNGRKVDFAELEKRAKVSVGWYLDLDTGYLLQPNPNGRVIKARRGKDELSDAVISELYGRNIKLPFSLEMDIQKPRFLPICDGFDYVEGVITAALAATSGLPRGRTLREISLAVRKAHAYAEAGFKKEMLRNPARYGIAPNDKLIQFLDALKERGYKLFLITSSKRGYVNRLLEILGIGGTMYFEKTGKKYFDKILTGVTKPACFHLGTRDNQRLSRALKEMRIKSPSEVLYIGDHLYKDVISARKAGFKTCLRMLMTYINTISGKLAKYGGVGFRVEGTERNLRIASGQIPESELPKIGNYYYQVYQHAHMTVPHLHYLQPLLRQRAA